LCDAIGLLDIQSGVLFKSILCQDFVKLVQKKDIFSV